MLGVEGTTAVLLIPAAAAAVLALLPGYRLTAQINVIASLLMLMAALSLRLTLGTDVCVQEYERSGRSSGLESVEPLPSRVTRSPSFTV